MEIGRSDITITGLRLDSRLLKLEERVYYVYYQKSS